MIVEIKDALDKFGNKLVKVEDKLVEVDGKRSLNKKILIQALKCLKEKLREFNAGGEY